MEGSLLFSDLKAGRIGQHVVARLLRFWEARNVKKGGELMGVDMLLLDAKSTLIQGSINLNRLNTFKGLLHEGSIYAIGGFDVTRSNHHFKLCHSPTAIRFTDVTTLVELTQSALQIPKEMFSFRSHEELLALANNNSELPDIIGEVCTIRAILNEETQTTHRIMAQIRMANDNIVCLSAFDSIASLLDHKLQSAGRDPTVILATNINPKFVGGKLYLNATSGTHFYFDEEVETSKSYTKEIKGKQGGESSKTKYCGVEKLESVTVAELNEYVIKSAPQTIDFLCTTKVVSIQSQNGWRYISCSKCSKKLIKGNSSFICNFCHNSNAVGVVRYRVELAVADSYDSAVFVAFDTDMTRLTNTRAANVGDLIVPGKEENLETTIPKFITDIVGKTFTFQLKLTEYNFSSKHQTFTISRIFDAPETPPTPTFVTQVRGTQSISR